MPLPANSRTTVVVHAPVSAGNPGGLGRGKAHATRLQTTVPTVVERPMYFLYQGARMQAVDGGHNTMGATALLPTGRAVVLAEGYTGAGFEQFLTFQNPNPATARARVTYLLDDGTTLGPYAIDLPANQRLTVAIHDATGPAGAGPDRAFATRVEVVDGGASGILVERVSYFRYIGRAGAATGGSSAFGQAVP